VQRTSRSRGRLHEGASSSLSMACIGEQGALHLNFSSNAIALAPALRLRQSRHCEGAEQRQVQLAAQRRGGY
jgi:hypothetical protein